MPRASDLYLDDILESIRRIERDSDRVLDLTGHFDGRAIREPALWTEAAYPALRDFLLEAAAEARPLLLDLAAHWSLAFAAGQRSIQSGAHALAHNLDQRIRSRTIAERYGTLHPFASAPNALLLFLGQLSRPFGRIQLHEHDFDATEPGAYTPSLRLPVS